MLDEAVAALALRGKDAVLSRNRGIVRGNLRILEKWAANEPNVYYVRPRAGTTALVHYRPDVPSYELCETMYKKTGAFVTPGDCFGEPKCFRIGYACDEETLKKRPARSERVFQLSLEKKRNICKASLKVYNSASIINPHGGVCI